MLAVERDGERVAVQSGPQSITLLVSELPELIARLRDTLGSERLPERDDARDPEALRQSALVECAGVSARALECIVDRLESIGMSINLLVQKGG